MPVIKNEMPAGKTKRQTKAQKISTQSQQALEAAKPKAGGSSYRDRMTAILDAKLHIMCGGWNEETQTPNVMQLPDIDLKITGRMARGLLGWETEEEYIIRKMLEDPSSTEEQHRWANLKPAELLAMPPWFKFGCNPKQQVNVVCWNNDRNRPIDLRRCEEFAQTILQRQWAGPSTLGSINGETGVIGATGQPLSCQHCLVALLMAIDIWNEQEKWHELWTEEPFIEKLMVVGVSEDAKIVQSIDNVRPRSLADELYVGDDFRDLIPSERREIARMGEKAIAFLWDRTEAEETTQQIGTKKGKNGGMTTVLTHSVAREFLGRHERLKKALRFIFEINKQGRGLIHLGSKTSLLSPGQCATMLYLMASSASDTDEYRQMDLPSEKKLDFERWDDACRFFSELAMALKDGFRTEDKIRWLRLEPVRHAIRSLADPEGQTSGNLLEKVNVLAMAWQRFANGEEIGSEDLEQQFFDLDTGEVVPGSDKGDRETELVNRDTFGGIDCCHVAPPRLVRNQTPEEKEAEAERIKQENRQKEAAEHQRLIDEAAAKQKEASAKKMVSAGLKPPTSTPNLDALAAKAKAGLGKGVNGKPLTSKQVQEAQTAKARANDEADAVTRSGSTKQPLKGGIG